MPTALLAEDEPLLLAELREALADLWPELKIVAETADGASTLVALRQYQPDVAFLDINMPKASGLAVARMRPSSTAVVFLTAYGQHALDAFDVGAADYLVKPLDRGRLLETIDRLRARTARYEAAPAPASAPARPVRYLAWIQASVGNMIRVITTDEVVFFQSDAKYTKVATAQLEALIRVPVKDLVLQLDPDVFIQISRGAIVNRRRIDAIVRREGLMEVRLKGRQEVLPVSSGYQGQAAFRQM